MKKSAAILPIIILYTVCIQAQGLKDINSGWGSLNYSVPESPANNLLGKNPDNIIKPTSAKDIAVSLGNYYLANGSTIPKNFGVEISPLLLSPNVNLYEYNKHPFWYRLRFSLGTNVLENGYFQVAEGLRFTLIDKTDLRGDKTFINELTNLVLQQHIARDKAMNDYLLNHGQTYKDITEVNMAYVAGTIKTDIDELVRKYYFDSEKINNYREYKKKELWNATIWEAGVAIMQQSPDSLIKNLKLNKAGIWTTYGTHFGQYDQLLIGGNFQFVNVLSAWEPKISIGSRYYYGKNELRGFVQGEYGYIDKLNSITGSAGLVFNITESMWGQLALNIIWDLKGNVSIVPGFNIGISTKEKTSM